MENENKQMCKVLLCAISRQHKDSLKGDSRPHHLQGKGCKGANTAVLDKLGLFPSLALCNKANFGYLQFPSYSVLFKCEYAIKSLNCPPFLNVNFLIN